MEKTPRAGRLEIVHGSMFAGKTEYLIARLREEQARGRRVRAFKHVIDDRYDPNHLVTHPGDQFDAIRVENASAILENIDQAEVIAVDEGHFFKRALVPVIEELLRRGLSVFVAGITNDSWGRPFEPMPQLAELADHEELKQAPCRVCGLPSPYTQRMTAITTEFMIGGTGDYEPRCAAHFTPFPGPPEQR